jgi:hypothetical protein
MPQGRQPGGLSDELDPYVDRAETDRFDRVGQLLRSQRPAPRAGFLTGVAGEEGTRTWQGLWAQVAASLAIGLFLLLLALLGASGSGPLGG